MATKLKISEECAFHLQVVNSWLPSHDHEFISEWNTALELSITELPSDIDTADLNGLAAVTVEVCSVTFMLVFHLADIVCYADVKTRHDCW